MKIKTTSTGFGLEDRCSESRHSQQEVGAATREHLHNRSSLDLGPGPVREAGLAEKSFREWIDFVHHCRRSVGNGVLTRQPLMRFSL